MSHNYAVGSFSYYPREAYKPSDLPDAGHVAFRNRLTAAARWYGLRGDALDEAVSAFYSHWFCRDYSRTTVHRGDHARAAGSTLCYARKSGWHGFTGERRQVQSGSRRYDSAGKVIPQTVQARSEEVLQWMARRAASMVATPSQLAEDMDDMAARPQTERARRARKLASAAGQSVAEWLAEAEGQDNGRAHWAPAPVADQPGQWLDTMTSKRPATGNAYAGDPEGYREAIAAYHASQSASPDYVADAASARAELAASRQAKAADLRAARAARWHGGRCPASVWDD